MKDVAVIRIVIDDENTCALKVMRSGNCTLQRIGTGLQTYYESEDTAPIERAFYADFSTHHLAQLLADGQTQTCAAVFSRVGEKKAQALKREYFTSNLFIRPGNTLSIPSSGVSGEIRANGRYYSIFADNRA